MKYKHRFKVNAPLAAVAVFHSDSSALRDLMPPPLQIQFHHLDPLAEGSVADFSMGVGPFKIRWTAVHTNVTLEGFTDTQQRGPFQAWQHKHSFHAIDAETTEVVDEIEAQPGGLMSWLMWLTLPFLFAYRGWQTRRLSPKVAV